MNTVQNKFDTVTNENFQKVDDFLHNEEKELVINGSAGTGKTYLLKELKEYEILPLGTFYTATTNKAAHVLAEYLETEVVTIYSLLNLVPYDDYRTGRTTLKQTDTPYITADVIVIDEAFMLTTDVLKYIRKAVKSSGTKIIYIGDSYQLPPVFFKNSPVENIKNVITLNKVRRSDKPAIKDVSQQLRDNVDTLKFTKLIVDNKDVQIVDSVDFINNIVTNFKENAQGAKIVAWTNDKVQNYNSFINKLLHQKDEFEEGDVVVANKPIVGNWGRIIVPIDGETQLQSIRDYTVTGLDMGLEHDFDSVMIDSKVIIIPGNMKIYIPNNPKDVVKLMGKYKSHRLWKDFFAVKNFFADIRLPYACTVHKSQGSTYHTVFVDVYDICKNQSRDEVAKLMYVAATRASHQIYFCLDTQNIEKEAQMMSLIT